MNRTALFCLAVGTFVLFGGATLAQSPDAPTGIQTRAEIRIELPVGGAPLVSVTPGGRHVLVELPHGSVFPLDVSSSSGGLLRGGEVSSVEGDRLLLRLELAGGLLDRIEYQPQRVVLHFESRFGAPLRPGQVEDVYKLGPEDRLLITIHNHPELTSHPSVTREGLITAPLVGDIEAVGLTPRALEVLLAELLGRSYLVDPQVDVEVEEYRSQWVMVTGEVQLPQRIFLHGGTRLKEAISEAGGFGELAGETITISRKVAATGEYASITVQRLDFEVGGADPVLQHGDIVEVTRAAYSYLQGEVRSPGRILVERGTTLLRAIALVGGLTEWADRKQIRVLYEPGTEPRERVFNLKRIQSGRDEDPQLMGGEVVVVKRRFF